MNEEIVVYDNGVEFRGVIDLVELISNHVGLITGISTVGLLLLMFYWGKNPPTNPPEC